MSYYAPRLTASSKIRGDDLSVVSLCSLEAALGPAILPQRQHIPEAARLRGSVSSAGVKTVSSESQICLFTADTEIMLTGNP